MTLTRVTEKQATGKYSEEVVNFMNTGWQQATSDLYQEKKIDFRFMGFVNAIKYLKLTSKMTVKVIDGDTILLSRIKEES